MLDNSRFKRDKTITMLDNSMFTFVLWIVVVKYQVAVHTGDIHKAGTDANVYIQIYGQRGTTGNRLLKYSLTNPNKFEQSQVTS